MEVSRPAAAAPSTMAEPMETSRPAPAAPSSMAEPMEASGPTAATPSLLAEPMPVTTPSALSDGDDGIIADHDREDASALSSSGDEAGPTDALHRTVAATRSSVAATRSSVAATRSSVAATRSSLARLTARVEDIAARAEAQARFARRTATRAETQRRRDLDTRSPARADSQARFATLRRRGPGGTTFFKFRLLTGEWVKVQRTSGTWERARVEEIGTPAGELPFIKFRFSKVTTKVIRAPSWDSHICLNRIWRYDHTNHRFIESPTGLRFVFGKDKYIPGDPLLFSS